MALGRLPGVLSQTARPIRLLDGTLPLAAMPLPGPLGLNSSTGLGAPGEGRPGGGAGGETPVLIDIRIHSGATDLPPGPDAPKNVKFAAKPAQVAGTGVAVEAVFSPDLSKRPGDVPPDVTWTIDGKPGQAKGRRIVHFPDGEVFRHDLTVTHRGASKRMVLYSFAANPTGFNPNKPSFSPDNDALLVKTRNAKAGFNQPLGVNGPNPKSGAHLDPCEMQFTLVPKEMIDDAKAGAFDKQFLQFRVTRRLGERTWVRLAGSPNWVEKTSRNYARSLGEFDDEHNEDKDNDPWTDGHLYGSDGPGDDNLEHDDDMAAGTASGWDGFTQQIRAREFVVFSFGKPAVKTDQPCSTADLEWHDFRRVAKVNGAWANDPAGTNEQLKGDRDFLPPT